MRWWLFLCILHQDDTDVAGVNKWCKHIEVPGCDPAPDKPDKDGWMNGYIKNMKHCHLVLFLLCSFRSGQLAANETDSGKGKCDEVSRLEAQRAVGAAVAKLGLTLLEKLQPGSEQPNIIISPLSISLLLAKLALGARNKTEEKLLEALQAKKLTNFHETLSCLQEELTAKAVKMASRLYLIPGFSLNQDFVDRALNLYKSEPAHLTSIEEVNQWVEEATKGHITNFLSSLPPNVVLMLINAIHFKGEWQSRFDSRFTVKDIFYIDTKTSVKVDMMMGSKYPLSMFVDRTDGTQVARFPFQGNMSLLVVMPMPTQGNLSDTAAKLNISDMYEHFQSEMSMQVKLPKFKLEYKQDLRQALSNMGLDFLFTGPDLSKIAQGPMVVSGVQHASSMELSEDGAEASAATSLPLTRTIPTFAVNMPFIFALVDDASYTPLFLGIVTNPNPEATMEQSVEAKTESSMKATKGTLRDGTINDSPHRENMLSLLISLWSVFSLSHSQLEDTAEAEGEEEPVDLFTTPRTKLAAATSDFGYNLFRQLAARDTKASIFLSPMSISAVFTQLSMGASKRAEKQIYRALRYHTLQDTQLHDTLRDLLSSLRSSVKGFKSAERLILTRKLRLRLEYLNSVEKQYGVRPHTLSGGARDLKTVNDWFKQETGVDQVIPAPLSRNIVLLPAGAALFKGKWITRFSKSNKMENFLRDGEAPVLVPMMEQENYPIAQVPMEDGVSMYFFLPDEVTHNLTLIEEALTAEFVQDLSNSLHTVQVLLTIPVIKLNYNTDLLPSLSDLGLSEWLENTDLTKITSLPVKLNAVPHKVVMEMAPEGAEYASTMPAARGQSLSLKYRLDRPFLFVVRDELSGALLFIGKVLNPSYSERA
ncbi:hypothetical protein DNTS_021809 [Danionella cerebrum]|uniref:Serpin domain-containing protein n=1 Tax=Danionella cerebrum TaxID=2873325 RepID=A0A553R875_9TELE|nr:hypothetical protein DNTS_021809 [Danionella translucida]